MIRIKTSVRWTCLLSGLLLLPVGCTKDEKAQTEDFFGDVQVSDTRNILDAQRARGARADATLYPVHFDGPGLAGLGREKLDLMLKDRGAALPLTVYLDLPASDSRTVDRRAAVETYLLDAGLLASQIRLEAGCNPDALHPSAPELANLSRTDSGSAPSSSADLTVQMMAPTGGSGGQSAAK